MRDGHVEFIGHTISPTFIDVSHCPLCGKEFLSGGRIAAHSHLRWHVRKGEMQQGQMRDVIEQIVTNGKRVKL